MMLIAEAGNCHFGDFDTAKKMIKVARDCGVDLIKFQAIDPEFVAKFGSMPLEFYEHVAFEIDEYKELIEIGNLYKMPVFFSCFGPKMQELWAYTFYHKISAKQAPQFVFNDFSDKESTFVSVNLDYGPYPELEKAKIMYACPYLPIDPDLDKISDAADFYERQVGYSDHTIGIDACRRAVLDFGAPWIEKHFTLDKEFTWEGMVFRDTIHSALPKDLEKLAKTMKGD